MPADASKLLKGGTRVLFSTRISATSRRVSSVCTEIAMAFTTTSSCCKLEILESYLTLEDRPKKIEKHEKHNLEIEGKTGVRFNYLFA